MKPVFVFVQQVTWTFASSNILVDAFECEHCGTTRVPHNSQTVRQFAMEFGELSCERCLSVLPRNTLYHRHISTKVDKSESLENTNTLLVCSA